MSESVFGFTRQAELLCIDEVLSAAFMLEGRLIAPFNSPHEAIHAACQCGVSEFVIWVRSKNSDIWFRW